MAISNANHQLALVVSSNITTSYEELLESQKELVTQQICELQNIVSKQCKLTGVNPLSQEMAAGALSIKIGKRPRDLLNPKAIKYMQAIFSVKDEISKKEMRAISALFGLTATQVRDFFTTQRTRVRRFIRLSREKALQSGEHVQVQNGSLNANTDTPNQPVPLSSVGPLSVETPSCSTQDEVLLDTNESDKYFVANIFNHMRKEETFSGQVKLMEWILQIQNASVLYWFLTNGGVMILATWLSEAAIEEQTTVLHTILRVLCHLPLHKALPAHMSAILQSVNKLRFYRGSDVSNRAKSLLSRWSKMFARSQAMRKPNANISPVDAQNEMLLKQSIGEIMENESLESRIDNPAGPYLLQDNSENSRNLGNSQPIKLLTAPSDESNIKLLRGISSHGRERRKVQLVEQPGQKPAGRSPQVTRVVSSNHNRPLSADDIQKAKMRAQFMRNKYMKTEIPKLLSTSQTNTGVLSSKTHLNHTKIDENTTSTIVKVEENSKIHVHPQLKTEISKLPSTSQANTGVLSSKTHLHHTKVEENTTSTIVQVEENSKTHVHPQLETEITKLPSTLTNTGVLSSTTYVHHDTVDENSSMGFLSPTTQVHDNKAEENVASLMVKVLENAKAYVEEHGKGVKSVAGDYDQEVRVHGKGSVDAEEPVWKKCKRVQISWVIPPEMKINKEWSVGYGENSKEIEIQNNRIKREKEAFYNSILEIPPNPKEPWDQEMDYDDSLTPDIPTEQLPDDDDDDDDDINNNNNNNNNIIPEDTNNYTSTSTSQSSLPENNNKAMAEPDLELLAVLLKNPEIVFALTAGQGGNLTNEQMVKLLDAIKENAARGGSINSLVNGLLVERKMEEKVEVSLPSPTPSSDPVTSGWRPEITKNPFTRQSMTVNGDNYSTPTVYFQETSQQVNRFSDLVPEQRSMSDLVPDRRNIPATPTPTHQTLSPAIHHRFPDMVNTPPAGGQRVNTSSNSYYSHPQQNVISEPRWTNRESLGSSQYAQVDHGTTYNAYGTTREFVNPGPSWVRSGGYRDEPGFDPWSSDNNPGGSREYVDGYNRSYNNYRTEMSRMHHESSRFRDRGGGGGGRNDGLRWRDRRR